MKLIFKVKDKNDEVSKLISVIAYKENIPKFTIQYYKNHITKGIKLIEKAKLMSYNSKANYLLQLFTKEKNVQHILNQKQIN